MATSKLSSNERLKRKRENARIRQQRCRARKRRAAMMEQQQQREMESKEDEARRRNERMPIRHKPLSPPTIERAYPPTIAPYHLQSRNTVTPSHSFEQSPRSVHPSVVDCPSRHPSYWHEPPPRHSTRPSRYYQHSHLSHDRYPPPQPPLRESRYETESYERVHIYRRYQPSPLSLPPPPLPNQLHRGGIHREAPPSRHHFYSRPVPLRPQPSRHHTCYRLTAKHHPRLSPPSSALQQRYQPPSAMQHATTPPRTTQTHVPHHVTNQYVDRVAKQQSPPAMQQKRSGSPHPRTHAFKRYQAPPESPLRGEDQQQNVSWGSITLIEENCTASPHHQSSEEAAAVDAILALKLGDSPPAKNRSHPAPIKRKSVFKSFAKYSQPASRISRQSSFIDFPPPVEGQGGQELQPGGFYVRVTGLTDKVRVVGV